MSDPSSESLVHAMPIPALLLDPEGRVSAQNKLAAELFGERIESHHYITALRQPALLDAVELALQDRSRTTAQYLATDARGDTTLEATCEPLDEAAGLLICFEDRTATETAGQMRRDFVANVSHELRTPLTALLGFIETLRGAARDDPEARSRFLGIMEREASRMNRLVADLLSLSRVETDERVRPTDRVDFASITKASTSTLVPMAEDLGVIINTAGLENPVMLPGDADQLAQVVTNLVENAVKYAGQSGMIDVSLISEGENKYLRGKAVVLSVSDKGEGIDPVHISRLTERFYRIDSHRSRELGGTGLGLAIVKHIVSRHRGRLRIESEPGVGSRFIVVLPAGDGPQ